MLKNFTIALAVVAVGFVGVRAVPASALSFDDVQAQIQKLVAQISDLTAQLNRLRAQVGTSNTDTTIGSAEPSKHRICYVLDRNLSAGAQGDDVRAMQEFLQSQGYLSASATGYFGSLTAQAVAKWQASEGVSAVGAFGPMSRARLSAWCGNPTPYPNPGTCRPVNYMPIACSDGSQAQAQHNESGCIIGYECPVANYAPPASCKAWNDGCNVCSRTDANAPVMCTQRACFAAGKGYCTTYFDNPTAIGNKPPVISGFSGPTTLALNTTGTWTINASDPENGSLSYQILWGDEYAPYSMNAATSPSAAFVQSTTFTHAYAHQGTYMITMIVRDSAGQQAQTSSTVQVSGGIACTMEYAPVCGQPPEPTCRHAIPACMIATPGPTTYSNRCMLDAAGASYLYNGSCTNGY